MKFDHSAFFDKYRANCGAIDQSKVEGIERLLSNIENDADVKDVRWAAYMLATVKHECADRWQPIEEYGKGRGRPYGKAVTVVGSDGEKYVNTYYGRGYVQLTWKDNYEKMGARLGMGDQLLIKPELALDPDTAYRIMSYGMRNGSFTGVGLKKYINDASTDYKNARRIINGLDQWARIKDYAEALEAVLKDSLVTESGYAT